MKDRSLLIIGAGSYSIIAYEIAKDMDCFERIEFLDENKTETLIGKNVIGKFSDISSLENQFTDVIVSIGNPQVRLSLLKKLEEETNLNICRLISPRAYIAPSAHVSRGCIVEPMAVVHSLCRVKRGCLISAGAVVNHESILEEGVHVDCNATIPSYSRIEASTKINYGKVFIS